LAGDVYLDQARAPNPPLAAAELFALIKVLSANKGLYNWFLAAGLILDAASCRPSLAPQRGQLFPGLRDVGGLLCGSHGRQTRSAGANGARATGTIGRVASVAGALPRYAPAGNTANSTTHTHSLRAQAEG